MAPKCCPIKSTRKCKWCPYPPEMRIKICNYFRGQVEAGVPWRS